jgi:hypothetical protein
MSPVRPLFDNGSLFGDEDGSISFAPLNLGLNVQFGPFVNEFVDALMWYPFSCPPVAAGENGASTASSTIFWEYNDVSGLTLDAKPGFLTTTTGNGGFSLHVGVNGDWQLRFYGTDETLSHCAGQTQPPPPPPAGNTLVDNAQARPVPPDGPNAYFYDASAGDITFNGTTFAGAPISALDTVAGGMGDYIIGGTASHSTPIPGSLALGNCAIYTDSAGSVLIDGQDGLGFGGTAEDNVLVNINQLRGSLFSNVLIGNSSGEDLKSGGNDSILVSTGGNGYELRPDGSGNVLVSTVGADRVVFDPTHGWQLGDFNTMLGFNPGHGDYLDLSLLGSTFHSTPGANINNYVALVDTTDGEHLMFNATGNVQTAGVDLLDMKLTHGLTAEGLYATHNLVI